MILIVRCRSLITVHESQLSVITVVAQARHRRAAWEWSPHRLWRQIINWGPT